MPNASPTKSTSDAGLRNNIYTCIEQSFDSLLYVYYAQRHIQRATNQWIQCALSVCSLRACYWHSVTFETNLESLTDFILIALIFTNSAQHSGGLLSGGNSACSKTSRDGDDGLCTSQREHDRSRERDGRDEGIGLYVCICTSICIYMFLSKR